MSAQGSPGASLRRGEARMRGLRAIVRDTQRALSDVADILGPGAAQLDPTISASVFEVGAKAARPPALLLLGRDGGARARLANCLLGERLLPARPTAPWRWIRLQYGNSRQVKLNLINTEFELVEELECHKKPWTIMPEKDLERRDPSDLSTIMDIELNNPFLKDGLKIIIPPYLDTKNETESLETFRQTHDEFYSKRMSILKQFTPICFYALNCTGKITFKDHSCEITRRISKESSRSEEDFWKTNNMYYMTRAPNKDVEKSNDASLNVDGVTCSDVEIRIKNASDNTISDISVFNEENFLDLQQLKELHPNLQIYFVLFSDSVPLKLMDRLKTTTQPVDPTEIGVQHTDQSLRKDVKEIENSISDMETEATESTEQALYKSEELPESDQELKDGKKADFSFRPDEDEFIEDDRSKLFVEQCNFMYDLMDQWQHACCGVPKTNIKHHWMILNEVEVLKNCDPKPSAPFLTKPVPNPKDNTDSVGKSASSLKKEKVRELERDRTRMVSTRASLVGRVTKYVAETIHNYLLEYCTKMSEIHVKLLQQFILTSFDMAREMQVVPKKIDYVAVHEQQLYDTISEKFSEGEKKQELVQMMQQVLQDMKNDINIMDWSVDDLPCHRQTRVSNSVFYGTPASRREPEINLSTISSEQPTDVEQAISYDSYNFEDYDIVTDEETAGLNSSMFQSTNYVNSQSVSMSDVLSNESSIISLIPVENESSINSSVFARIMDFKPSGIKCTSNANVSIKQASLDVQKTVLTRLSRMISLRLIKFVDCLRDSYFGTLQRCLESLEASCREELGGRPATEAMRQVLSVARQVDLQSCASFSVLRTLVEHFRRLFQRLKVGGGGPGAGACCVLSPVWRKDVALHTLHTLSPARLARLISAQILEKLSVAHERYQSALATLATTLETRLHQTEDVKLAIRKRYAPGFARLCLESTSMCDVLQHGSPELGREIGRGQYGVVYACKGGWAGHEPCAVKSVLPSDERHYNELAMEFFYTRSIPPHPRIVRLWGSAVERHASGSPTVLLVTERKRRDLHCAVRSTELSFAKRCRISLDIVEGIRYLHSLGLVHRDIKMKNVLLDEEDRASLTDLGFCMPEALISGSVVGTPVHMAPELLTGDYDSSVDVYAFGILFWYVCAGNIKLPSAFELFQNKEQLWSKVRRGLRPERLPHFTDECWSVMESCWAPEPSQRALLGDVQPVLERILQRSLQEDVPARPISPESLWCDDTSLNFSRFDVV